ncbi:MAG: hypothetical protein M3328_17360, partial [Chloroflexota bacterium]|nr:hypothetical protein [Chloroflexota bacterium]
MLKEPGPEQAPGQGEGEEGEGLQLKALATLMEQLGQDFPQLSFEIIDNGVPNTIYVQTDTKYNNIIFRITTNTDTSFTPGKIGTDPNQPPSGSGTVLYLDLSPLNMTSTEFSSVSASATGWTCQPLTTGTVLGMTPTTSFNLGSGTGDKIDITISGVSIGTPPQGASATLPITYYNAPPTTVGTLSSPGSTTVLLQVAPDKDDGDLHKEIVATVDNPYIITSLSTEGAPAVANIFYLVFSPGTEGLSVPAGEDTEFQLTFTYADAPGYGALTDTTNGGKIGVTYGQYSSSWEI